jgi:MFS family permease
VDVEEHLVHESGVTGSATVPWHRSISREQWRALLAAKFGWMLDAADFMLYAMALGHIRAYFEMNDRTAGLLATTTLVMSGVGGLLFGYIADRFGRTRALSWTILIFSLASLGASTSQTIIQLAVWRAALGIGMGGEWASGAVLVSETWPAAHRNKASAIMQSGWALGYIAAALLAAGVLGNSSPAEQRWRWLFVAGVLPALFTLWIRRHVREPAVWTRGARASTTNPFAAILGPDLRSTTLRVALLTTAVQFAYWGIFFWLPSFLSRPVAQGGAGMGIVGSTGWIVAVQLGAYAGYLTFGVLADRIGRRRSFVLFMLAAAAIVPVYAQLATSPRALLILSPIFGYFGHGYFSMFGAFIAELFPTAVRATAQGATYNVGRMAGAAGPWTIGALASVPGVGLGLALMSTSAFFLLAAALVFTLPDRSGQEL